MVAVCAPPGEKEGDDCNESWLWRKCRDKSLKSDRRLSAALDGKRRSGSSNWREGEEGMDACSIAKCFLVPMWWPASRDRVQKHLVLSHGVNGPSASIVLWKNYMGFDYKGVRRNLGALIRAHDSGKRFSGVEDVEDENQSILGSMLGTAVSKYVNAQLEHCGELEVHIAGTNREILNGQLKNVKISAKQVIYKGVTLSDVDISARSIQIKLGKRRLLQNPVQVKALISICEKDMKASLASPLVANYLRDIIPDEFGEGDDRFDGVNVGFENGVILLTNRNHAKLGHKSSRRSSVALSFDIMNGGKTVRIRRTGDYDQSNCDEPEKSFTVGSETSIKKLGVVDSRLVIGGEFCVTPS